MLRTLPSVWRIAFLAALLICTGLALLFGYQIFWLENTHVIENFSSVQGNPIIGFVLIELLFAAFIIGLITFPYYFFSGFLGGFSGFSRTDSRNFVVGLGASVACILVTLLIAFLVLDLGGGRF